MAKPEIYKTQDGRFTVQDGLNCNEKRFENVTVWDGKTGGAKTNDTRKEAQEYIDFMRQNT